MTEDLTVNKKLALSNKKLVLLKLKGKKTKTKFVRAILDILKNIEAIWVKCVQSLWVCDSLEVFEFGMVKFPRTFVTSMRRKPLLGAPSLHE